MPSKVQQNRRGRTVGPNIVRAWFDTVINPLLAGLETERDLLAAEAWTWRYRPPRLLSFVPIRQHLFTEAWGNLKQFLDFYPECQKLARRHDDHVSKLQQECHSFHDALASSTAMREAYERVKAGLSAAEKSELADFLYNGDLEEQLNVLAEYVVNGATRLPPFLYITAPLWNPHHAAFLQLRNTEDLQPLWEAVRARGRRLAKTVVDLDGALRRTRDSLSTRYDVPLVQYTPEREFQAALLSHR